MTSDSERHEAGVSRRDFALGAITGGTVVGFLWGVYEILRELGEAIGSNSVPNLNPDEEPYDDD